MNQVIRFRSKELDLSVEPTNPINAIPGAVVLQWLQAQPELAQLSEPSPEDWGWYSHLDHAGRTYMVGACIYPEPSGEHECLIQFEKHRTMLERISGRAKIEAHDPVVASVLSAVQRLAVPGSVAVEHGP
jgi:hypothetical protein